MAGHRSFRVLVTPIQDGGPFAVAFCLLGLASLAGAIFTAVMAEAEWRGSDAVISLAIGSVVQALYLRAIFLACLATAFGALGLLTYRMHHFKLGVAEETASAPR